MSRSQRKSIDPAIDLAVRHGSHIADLICFRLHSRHNSCQVSGLIHSGKIRSHVIRVIIKGIGIESDIRIFFNKIRHFLRVTVTGQNDHLTPLLHKVFYRRSALSFKFLDIFFCQKIHIQVFACFRHSLVMRPVPALISDASRHDKSDFLFGMGCLSDKK